MVVQLFFDHLFLMHERVYGNLQFYRILLVDYNYCQIKPLIINKTEQNIMLHVQYSFLLRSNYHPETDDYFENIVVSINI